MKLTDKLLVDETDESEREIVEFGVNQLIALGVGITISVLISILLKEFVRTTLLLLCLLPLRQNAGGFHLKNRKICTAVSVTLLVSMVLMMKYTTIPRLAALTIWAIGSIPIVTLSPIGNANRELDDIERDVFGRRARMIWLVETTGFLSLWGVGLSCWYIIIMLSTVLTGLLVVIGYIQECCFQTER